MQNRENYFGLHQLHLMTNRSSRHQQPQIECCFFFIYINSCWRLKGVQRRTNIAISFWRWVSGHVLFCNSLGGSQTNSAWRRTSRGERDTPVLCMFTSRVLVEVTQWLACLPAGLVVMALVLHWGRFENLIWAPRSIQTKLGIRKRSWEVKTATLLIGLKKYES